MKSAKDQSSGLAFNGQGGSGYSRGTDASKEQVNAHTGHLNDGRLVNFGRGPTGGGTQVPNRGKEMFTGRSQVRTPGGTKEMPKRGQTRFDFKRGPTKGNQ